MFARRSLGFGTRERRFDPKEERSNSGWTFDASYETSPVRDSKRAIDLPFDENIKPSAACFRQRQDKWD